MFHTRLIAPPLRFTSRKRVIMSLVQKLPISSFMSWYRLIPREVELEKIFFCNGNGNT